MIMVVMILLYGCIVVNGIHHCHRVTTQLQC